jgi:hypothetical protein
VSADNTFVGAGTVIMALCCSVLPLAGAALGGGLIAGAGTVGAIAGVVVLGAIGATVWRRRGPKARC